MEVILIEKKTFETLMQSISVLNEKIHSLKMRENRKRQENWLTNEEVCRLLRISPRTLQDLRNNGKIGYSKINKRCYYKLHEVRNLIENAR